MRALVARRNYYRQIAEHKLTEEPETSGVSLGKRAVLSHGVSCFRVMQQLATECFAWRLCAISCITGVTVMQETL